MKRNYTEFDFACSETPDAPVHVHRPRLHRKSPQTAKIQDEVQPTRSAQRKRQERAVTAAKKADPEWWWNWTSVEYGLAFQKEIRALKKGTSKRTKLAAIEQAIGRIICNSIQWGTNFSDIPVAAIVEMSGFTQPTVTKAIRALENKAWFSVSRDRRAHRYFPLFTPALKDNTQ